MASGAKVLRLELYNFKSYQGHMTVGPFLDFTCIVGGNGSGKSNLMDALSFVLGHSTATLRGQHMEDFINRKAKKKECSVGLVIRVAGGAERTLARAVNAKGQVTVSIDSHAVNETEFRTALTKLRIGQRLSTFLVFQHEVDAVAQKKARELTDLIEEVSGSGELKGEYDAKRKVLEVANERLEAASTDKRGALAEVQQMRIHKKEAERYEKILEELTQERRHLALTELFYLETQLSRQKKQLETHSKEVSRFQETITSGSDVTSLKKQYAEKHKKYLDTLKVSRDINVKTKEKSTTMERIKASIDHFKKKLARDESDLATAKASSVVRSQETDRLTAQLKQQEQLLATLEDKWKKEDKDLSQSHNMNNEQLTEYRTLRKEADCQTITKRQELDTLRRNRDTIQQTLRQAQNQQENAEAMVKELTQNIQRNEAAVEDARKRLQDHENEEKMKRSELEEARTALAQTQSKTKDRDEELARIETQLRELRSVREVSKQDRKINEALTALRSMHTGIRGRLVDLCTIPNPKYRNAVTVAMGKNLEAIVVDSTETALACIRYLKDQRVGTLSFIPLNSAQGKAVDDSVRTFGGTCKPVVDVVKFDPSILPAIRYALGQTLVCDSMEEARRVAFEQPDGTRHKVVTIDGSTLMKNGAIQGGLASVQSRAKKWDEKQYDQLAAAREALLAEGSSEAGDRRMLSKAQELEAICEGLRNRIVRARDDMKHAATRGEKYRGDLKKAEEQGKTTKVRVSDLSSQIQQIENDMLGVQKQISAIEATIFGDFQKKIGISNIADIEEKAAQLAKTRSEKRSQLQLTIHRLKTAIEAEQKRIGLKVPEELEKAVKQSRAEVEHGQKELSQYVKVLDEWVTKQKTVTEELTAARTELEALTQALRKHSKTSESDVQRLAQARKSVTMLQSACEAIRQQRLSLFQRCRMEEIDLPTVSPDSPESKKRTRKSDVPRKTRKRSDDGDNASEEEEDDDEDEASNPLLLRTSEAFTSFTESDAARARGAQKRDETLCIDFSALSAELRKKAANSGAFANFKSHTEAIIEQYERDLESVAPNLKATSRFAKSEQKLGSSSDQVEQARDAARKALAEFTRVKELRVQRFTSAFDRITESLDRVYKELTLGTRAHDVHGNAYLSLDDQDEPYNGGVRFHASPPKKRFLTIDLLSGGERTMAALALLFAIHSTSPTPFFVLDEVDAALDPGNVMKLAQYMRKHADTCQFLVVSLKDQLYHIADSLVGVYKDQARESSGTLSLDLRAMPMPTVAA